MWLIFILFGECITFLTAKKFWPKISWFTVLHTDTPRLYNRHTHSYHQMLLHLPVDSEYINSSTEITATSRNSFCAYNTCILVNSAPPIYPPYQDVNSCNGRGLITLSYNIRHAIRQLSSRSTVDGVLCRMMMCVCVWRVPMVLRLVSSFTIMSASKCQKLVFQLYR